MPDIVWDDVTDAFPNDAALAAIAAGAAAGPLAVANGLSAWAFGGSTSGKYKYARVLVAAHYAMHSGSGGTPVAGPVISEATKSISRTYAQLNKNAGTDWSSTTYGQQYAELVRTSAARWPRVM